jgi:CRP/FNR family transcriptional regulator
MTKKQSMIRTVSEDVLPSEARNSKMNRRREQATRPFSSVDILEPLSEEELRELAARCPDIHLQKGEEFYRQAEHNRGLFIIKSGRMQVYKLSLRGRQLTLAMLYTGSVLTGGRRMWGLHLQAMEPSIVCFVRPAVLERLIRRRPEVGLRLIDVLADELHLMDELLYDVIHKDVAARLASLILRLLDREGIVSREGYRIPTRYTHEQLGTMIGARRVAVTNAFNHLRKSGILETTQHRIRVTNKEALERAAAKEK